MANDHEREELFEKRLHRLHVEELLTEIRDMLLWRFRDDPMDGSATELFVLKRRIKNSKGPNL